MSVYLRLLGRSLDYLQSVFSLKIRLVLISSSAIANHDVVITIETRRDETRREKTFRVYALVSRGCAARVLRFRVQ